MEEQSDTVIGEAEDEVQLTTPRREQRQTSNGAEQPGASTLTGESSSVQPDKNVTTSPDSDSTEGEHHIKTGQPGHPQKTKTQFLTELNSSFTDLKEQLQRLTTEFFSQSDPDEIRTRKAELETLKTLYDDEYNDFDKSELPEATVKALVSQRATMDMYANHYQALFKVYDLQQKAKQQPITANSSTQTTHEPQPCIIPEEVTKRDEQRHNELLTDFRRELDNLRTINQMDKDAAARQIQSLEEKVGAVQMLHGTHYPKDSAEDDPTVGINTADETIDQLRDDLKSLYDKVQQVKESLTPEFIQRASTQTLESKEVELRRLKESFQLKYDARLAMYCTEEEKTSLLSQRAVVNKVHEQVVNSIDAKRGQTQVQTLLKDKNAELIGAPEKKNATSRCAAEKAVVTLKIDSIQLPFFNGDLTQWEAFKDLFEYLIHKNEELSDTVKFHQLRSHLKGIAFDTIRGYQLTGTNYHAAWHDLQKRFNRKEDLVQEYIRKFLEVAAISHRATFMNLRAIIDATNQMLRALPNLGVEVSQWDPFINLIIALKLDEETRTEWKQRKPYGSPSVTELLEWLETRAIELQPSSNDRLSRMLKGDTRNSARGNPPRKIFQITPGKGAKPKRKMPSISQPPKSPPKCSICGGDHKVRDCPSLRKAGAKARSGIIKTLKLCFKCLLKHQIGTCDHEDCSYCGGPHHILLCYKKENDTKPINIPPTGSRQQPVASTSAQPSGSQESASRKPLTERNMGWNALSESNKPFHPKNLRQ